MVPSETALAACLTLVFASKIQLSDAMMAESPWNLTNIASIDGSLLSFAGSDISGMVCLACFATI